MNIKPFCYLAGLLATSVTSASAQPALSIQERAADAFAALEEKCTLRFFDAVQGEPIPGATVTFEGRTATTGGDGSVTFPLPPDLGPEASRDAHFRAEGYVESTVPIKFMVGTLFFNRFSISPVLDLGRMRVVVDWSDSPADLDLHLVKEGGYHISYRNLRNHQGRARLDRDDTNGHGPETLTIAEIDPRGSYHFYVHNYTHRSRPRSSSLSESRARVSLFGSSSLLHSFEVPRSTAGTFWSVFEIESGEVRVIDALRTEP